ncbi:hypothetical protein INT45_006098 [Circinella minor]|uniref:Uncharacterized protein n=1 Tax=Circinella minor TaxID=1195481 RepID=A0A8H7S5H6_9FUNG|nr:hypothetical protein INT45_006098 [Circinella minor]
MDPGQSHLERVKKVPNLIDEDPSICTPAQQKGYMDMPWKDFAAMMQRKSKEHAEKDFESLSSKRKDSTNTSRSSSGTPAVEEGHENEGAWDSETGYQDENHASEQLKHPNNINQLYQEQQQK